MSAGKLGNLTLADTVNARNALEEKLAGEDGQVWLTALEKFLRNENPWPRDTPTIDPWENPWKLSVEEQIERLRRAFAETFTPEFRVQEPTASDLQHLSRMAPQWPEDNRLAFRGFQKRFGTGSQGVALTYRANEARIAAVFGEQFSSGDGPPEETFRYVSYDRGEHKTVSQRLLVGDHTHVPTLKWVLYNIDRGRYRTSIRSARSSRSLADEAFGFVWMFPEYIRETNCVENPGLLAAGYQAHIPGSGGWWRYVPNPHWYANSRRLRPRLLYRTDDRSAFAIPELQEAYCRDHP